MRVAKTREGIIENNSQILQTWKPNPIEPLSRITGEAGRFYELNQKKNYGLKAVHPPGRAQSYHELVQEEQQNYDFGEKLTQEVGLLQML